MQKKHLFPKFPIKETKNTNGKKLLLLYTSYANIYEYAAQ